MPYRSTEVLSPGPGDKTPLHSVTLAHDARHLRRKLLHLENDDVVMLDLREPVMLADGDLLVLDGDRQTTGVGTIQWTNAVHDLGHGLLLLSSDVDYSRRSRAAEYPMALYIRS